ncbi:MAG: ATP-grasp domain-containing protein [Woeseiaceae bacterium]
MKKTTAFIISHEPDATRTAQNQATSIIALTLTRALGREGVKVVRVHPNQFDDSLYSRYSHTTEICPNLYESESDLVAFLDDLGDRYPGKKVLVPASDDCSLFLAKYSDELHKNFVLLNPTPKTMESIKDKRRQYELAVAVGVPIPETYFPESRAEVAKIAAQLDDFPYVIKPLEAQKWRLKQYADVASGNKAITVHSRTELIDEYTRIATADSNLMIQEIITGKDEHLITFLGYCSEKYKPLAHCIRSKLRQAPVDFGYCTATVTCHNEVVEQYAKRLLNQCGYVGIVGIEFKYDPKTNDYKLIEINTRPVNTTGISMACGVNLPVIAYRDALGEEQQPIFDWEDGVIWMRLAQDIGAGLELRRRGRLTVSQWFRSIRGKRVHALLAFDDLRPCTKFYARYTKRQLGKLVSGRRRARYLRGPRRLLQRVSAWMF